MIKLKSFRQTINRQRLPSFPYNFSGGINNTDPEENLPRNQISAGLNMFLDRLGGAYNRNGAVRKNNFLGATTGILNLFNFTNNNGTQAFLSVYDTGLYYDNSNVWTAVTGISLTTNKKAEGVFFSETNKFYIVNGTDNAVVVTSTSSATTDANFKKGTFVESFDGRLVTGGVSGSENRLWVTDLGVDTFGANNYIDLDGKLFNAKSLHQKLMLIWTDRMLYKTGGFTSTPNASGPEYMYEVDKVGLVGTRAVVVLDRAAYFIGHDSHNVVDLFGSDGQQVVRLGNKAIKNYLSNLNSAQISNLCLTAYGQFLRFSVTATGETTNLREYIYDTVNKIWMTEFKPGFPITCYATVKSSGQDILYGGHQSLGQVYQLNSGLYDELANQSYTAGQDADEAITASTTVRAAQGFKLSHAITQTRLITGGAVLMKKVSGTTTELTVRIETDSSGVPSGTLADSNLTTTIDAFTDSSYVWKTFSFTTPAALTGNTQYHLVVKHTTEGSGSSAYAWGSDGSSPTYANGSTSNYASGAWTADSATDCLFVLFIEEQIESFVTQTTNLDSPVYPKKMKKMLVEGQSSSGITAQLGIGYEGKNSSFVEHDLDFTGKNNVWASSASDTAANRLVWASTAEDEGSQYKWSSGLDKYSLSVFTDSYISKSRYFSFRFYYKGIGDFRINNYTPVFDIVPSLT